MEENRTRLTSCFHPLAAPWQGGIPTTRSLGASPGAPLRDL